ncbi:MAG: 3-deoxy-manno-octulosonate cytidylyltransferase [Bryobacterales bacterium]|nr:3-deoxy-manno-octulosonate cytidylyltransferase [Bryobacterales bacterium]
MPQEILGVIPARYASSRFPGKPLAPIAGKPMLQHVWERAARSRTLSRLVIATDDERILEAAGRFGAPARMTGSGHRSGSDRCAEVAAGDPAAALVVNIQGDEPLLDPATIDAAVNGLLQSHETPMSTLKKRIDGPGELEDPNVVKVVTDRSGHALYFSRSMIPYARSGGTVHYKHIGLYAFRREFLLAYSCLPAGPLEEAEKLEQLRALENGFKIRVIETASESVGVDTPEDLERVRAWMEAGLRMG